MAPWTPLNVITLMWEGLSYVKILQEKHSRILSIQTGSALMKVYLLTLRLEVKPLGNLESWSLFRLELTDMRNPLYHTWLNYWTVLWLNNCSYVIMKMKMKMLTVDYSQLKPLAGPTIYQIIVSNCVDLTHHICINRFIIILLLLLYLHN